LIRFERVFRRRYGHRRWLHDGYHIRGRFRLRR
jgi:hypothetical protein